MVITKRLLELLEQPVIRAEAGKDKSLRFGLYVYSNVDKKGVPMTLTNANHSVCKHPAFGKHIIEFAYISFRMFTEYHRIKDIWLRAELTNDMAINAPYQVVLHEYAHVEQNDWWIANTGRMRQKGVSHDATFVIELNNLIERFPLDVLWADFCLVDSLLEPLCKFTKLSVAEMIEPAIKYDGLIIT